MKRKKEIEEFFNSQEYKDSLIISKINEVRGYFFDKKPSSKNEEIEIVSLLINLSDILYDYKSKLKTINKLETISKPKKKSWFCKLLEVK